MNTGNFVHSDRDSVIEDDYIPSGASTPVEDGVKTSFERDVDDARSLERRYEKSSTVEKSNARRAFVNDRFGAWRKRTKNESWNFLHHLAYSNPTGKPYLQWLMARAISKLPELMGELDITKRTPLAVALSDFQRNDMFVHAACKNTTPNTRKLIGESLKSECGEHNSAGDSMTCLHWAVQRAINPELITILTTFVPVAMFTATDAQGRTPLHVAVEYERCGAAQVDIVRALLVRGQAALSVKLASDYGQCTVYQHHEYTRREAEAKTIRSSPGTPKSGSPSVKSPATNADHKTERRVSSVKIKDLLKFMYLRTRKPLEAAECLHIQGQPDKELWFDFGPKPSTKVTEADFKRQFDHLEFDKVLQYVAFPRVEFDRNAESSGGQAQGRNDMSFFFDWLRKKGVQRIIRVEVDDMSMPCHTNETIEAALKTFGVEILDWRKPDLSPLVLSKIGGNLREVRLQWSGHNSMLSSWSGPQGLVLTPTLKKIEIRLDEEMEKLQKTQSSLNEFEARLQQSWSTKAHKSPPVVITGRSTGGGRIQQQGTTRMNTSLHGFKTSPNKEPLIAPHRWMSCMADFSFAYKNINGIKDQGEDPLMNPVTVALIDDGVDLNHPDLQGRNWTGKSFDTDDDKVTPYWESHDGHGTLMARLIHRMCPSVVIYVIKTGMRRGTLTWSKDPIIPETCLDAIEHAIGINPQIISMSWNITPPEDASERMAFDQAVLKAKAKGILMFSATADNGNFHDRTYPFASNPGHIFRIGAATADGRATDWTTSDNNVDFILPGQDVVLGKLYTLNTSRPLPKSEAVHGSSVATALAAGLAAMVIECVRLGVIYTTKMKCLDEPGVAIKREDLMKIRTKEAMTYAFNSLSVNRRTGENARYIDVWDTIPHVTENMMFDGSQSKKYEAIAALARVFLRTGVKW